MVCVYPDHIGERDRPVDDFPKNGKTKTGYQKWCRACNALYRRQYRQTRAMLRQQTPLEVRVNLPTEQPGLRACDACKHGFANLHRYIYGEKGVGAVEHHLCERCDLTCRAANDDVLRLAHVLTFLLGCRADLVTLQTAARLHSTAG
jgi:hypothetical protein